MFLFRSHAGAVLPEVENLSAVAAERRHAAGARPVSLCKRTHNYFAHDLIQIFGDVDIDSLMRRMKCERCGDGSGTLDVNVFAPTGKEAVGLKIRRLVRIEFRRVPVWKEE
jgi:hypothetical protein